MPRKSAAALSVVRHKVAVEPERLAPPAHLPAAERAIWLEVVNDQPAGAFTQVHGPLLEMYCRHVVQARLLAEELHAFDPAWLADEDGFKRYDRLLVMHERECRAASSLATRLRITRQSIDDKTLARAMGREPTAKKPWEADAECT